MLFFLKKDKISLKIDLVNDIARHYGKIKSDETFGRIDSWRNILSNKISAIFRYEAKDFADILFISKNEDFNWQEIIDEAKTKEAGVDPVAVFEILKSFPADVLKTVKWVSEIDEELFIRDLSIIAEDILNGSDNSMHEG